MSEIHLHFTGAMVRAVLTGRKTMTRRESDRWARVTPGDQLWVRESYRIGRALDGLAPRQVSPHGVAVHYEADGPAPAWAGKLRPSILMPRWASRITLEIVSIRRERVQAISDADVAAEGVDAEAVRALWEGATRRSTTEVMLGHGTYLSPNRRMMFIGPGVIREATPLELWRAAWILINGRVSWDTDQLLYAITFRRSP